MLGRQRTSVLVAIAALATATACSQLVPTAVDDGSRVIVTVPATEADAVGGAVAAVERAVATVPGATRIRSVGCATGGAVLVHVDAADADVASLVHHALSVGPVALPPGTGPATVEAVADDVIVLSVRSDNVFAARAFVDEQLTPALKDVPGVYDVAVSGGRTERQLQVDPERMLATDLSLPEVLAAAKVASNLDKAEVKRLPGNVTIFLRDVAKLVEAPAGEPLRKDGGVEVRVRGHRSAARGAVAAVRSVTPPAGIGVAILDDDSVEVVTVLVSRRGRGTGADSGDALNAAADDAVDAAFADVAAAALSVPGVHTFRRGRSMSLTLDRARLVQQGLSAREINAVGDVAAAATTGLVIPSVVGPLRVVMGAVSTPEALLRTRVATRDNGQPVRLFDVARATLVEEQRRERLELHPARRLRLSFDAGVRQRALEALEGRMSAISKARPGVSIAVERDGDTAPLDAVCP